MNIARNYLMLATLLGGLVTIGLSALLWASYQQRMVLEQQVASLKSQLETQLQTQPTVPNPGADPRIAGPGVATSPVDQMVKDLSTRFIGDPRSIAQKLRDFVSSSTSDAGNEAIAAKVLADLANNSDALSDKELYWLFQAPLPPMVRRVAAQVLSYRGNNELLDQYIAQFKAGLASADATEHRAALNELGKTRYHRAADLIEPSLGHQDLTVVLDALLALNLTGNQRHVARLSALTKHGDASVAWQAQEVLNNLELLSDKARVKVSLQEMNAEIPIIPQ